METNVKSIISNGLLDAKYRDAFIDFIKTDERYANDTREGFTDVYINYYSVDSAIDDFQVYLKNNQEKIAQSCEEKEKQLQLEREQQMNAEREKAKALSSILITSGFNFDGYTIKKYSGYISGDDAVRIPRDNFFGTENVADNLCAALVKIRRQALMELKEAAYNLGCNAVIGVDFDYLTMEPEHSAVLSSSVTVYEPYVICVTANGNAVIIEKDEN